MGGLRYFDGGPAKLDLAITWSTVEAIGFKVTFDEIGLIVLPSGAYGAKSIWSNNCCVTLKY